MKIKPIYIVLTILTVILIVFLIERFDTIWFLFEIRDFIQNWLSEYFSIHINKHLISALTIPLVIILYKVFRLLISSDSKKRWLGIYIYSGLLVISFISLYFFEKDYIFNPKTGKSEICFTILPNGIIEKISCEAKIHPKYGTAVIKSTPELVTKYEVQNNNTEITKISKPEISENTRFFDNEGNALWWFYQYPDGTIDLYGFEGRHPRLNIQLQPINSKIAAEIDKEYRKGNFDKVNDNGIEAVKKMKKEYKQGSGLKSAIKNLSENE